MATSQTIDNIKKTFLLGLPGILKTSGPRKVLTTAVFIISFSLSIVFIGTVYATQVEPYSLIIDVKNNIITFLPSILGFTIGGYALVVGFVQSNMMNKISEPLLDEDYSLYQRMTSTFALNLIIQGFGLIVAYFYHYVIYIDSNAKQQLIADLNILKFINYVGLWFLAFNFLISLFLVVQIIINIFNFSQLHHYTVNIEKVDQQEEKNNSNGSPTT